MTRFRILPYRTGSKSAKALAEALGGKRLKLEGSTFVPREGDVLVNWGNSEPYFVNCNWVNDPALIGDASNKLKFFLMMGARCPGITPRFWINKDAITEENFPVVCRTKLTGHSGEGIVIANTFEELVDAPLYVQYRKKKDEYRVHIGIRNNEPTVIAIQRKARRLGFENPNWQVRNHCNGFVFVRNDVNPPSCVVEVASKALVASSLDFGAVDVIYNESENKAYVLEINTAPGLEGQTVQDYAEFFKEVSASA